MVCDRRSPEKKAVIAGHLAGGLQRYLSKHLIKVFIDSCDRNKHSIPPGFREVHPFLSTRSNAAPALEPAAHISDNVCEVWEC